MLMNSHNHKGILLRDLMKDIKRLRRLTWEQSNDCNLKFRDWIISNDIATEDEITAIDRNAKKKVREGKINAWKKFSEPIRK